MLSRNSKIEVLQTDISGRYRKYVVKMDDDWPGYVRDDDENRIYFMVGDPVFPVLKPGRADCIEDLIAYEPPPMKSWPAKSQMIVERNSALPITLYGVPDDEFEAHMDTAEKYAAEKMVEEASRAGRSGLLSNAVVLMAVTAAILAIALVAIAGLGFWQRSEADQIRQVPAEPAPAATVQAAPVQVPANNVIQAPYYYVPAPPTPVPTPVPPEEQP